MDEKQKVKIRSRLSYKEYDFMYEASKRGPVEAVRVLHKILDDRRAYNSETQALYAQESLELFIQDKGGV